MLVSLHVKNLALIEEAEIDFTDHFNILTGETGAGKSILIGSIQSALGGKIPRDMIRPGCDSALIELFFQTKNPLVREKMEEMDLPFSEGEILLSRRITSRRVINKINDMSVTAAALKELSPCLLDLSGQHENQLLLKPQNHLSILDSYDSRAIAPAKKKVAELYRSYALVNRQLSEENLGEEERNREMDFLKYEIEEITKADLREGEDEELERTFQTILHSRDILSCCHDIYEQTSEGPASVESLLGRAVRAFSDLSYPEEGMRDLEEQLATVEELLSDFNRDMAEYMASMEFDEETFVTTEKRLDDINRLKAKYGGSLAAIADYRQKAEERLSSLQHFDERMEALKEERQRILKELETACETLTRLRKAAAVPLADAIKEALLDLNFLDVRFALSFTATDAFSANGRDAVCFQISTNPGMDLKPLKDIASGGELSRIMLAIKSVLADEEAVDTLIFDEIDAGIGGRTAQKVSERLAKISENRQVIAITHLPQIAAMADSHFLIEKTSEQETTISRIFRLNEEESVKELARMLGGAKITDLVLENAREMKQMAKREL